MNTVFADERILVRPPVLEDVPALCLAVRESIAEVSPWLPWCHAGYRQEETQRYVSLSLEAWSSRARFPFIVADKITGELLGGVGLNHVDADNRTASLGYWVRSSRTGQGVATAAARLVSKFAFGEAALTRLEIFAIPENAPSRRVAEKLGAKFECIARNRVVMHGKAYDAAVYGLVPGDVGPLP